MRLALLLLLAFTAYGAHAQARDPAGVLAAFGQAFVDGANKFSDTEDLVDALAATGSPDAAQSLRALSKGELMVRLRDGAVFVARRSGTDFRLLDPITGDPDGKASRREVKKVRVKNSIRRRIAGALSGLTLRAPSRLVRLRAANTIFRQGDAGAIDAIDAALADEADAAVRTAFASARASAVLSAERPEAETLAAIETLRTRGDRAARGRLANYAAIAPAPTAEAARKAVASIDRELALWGFGRNVWYGVSLGSVLFLAAIGLAITFGVMGVINMAHGEMVMLGAYTTFAVQEAVRGTPLFEWSLLMALPASFLVAGGVGLAMERGIIRFLYGRPLETLLATWGVSLILQQSVRTIFGPNNREVGNPDFMSGAFRLGELSITWNRLWILAFALAVFAVLLVVLKRTRFGLHMRAVTQNRPMAASMGIRTSWVDAFTFALGSGIAGIAGVALSQIDNVSPNLGQSYVIDSFLVVVFGGVGNLWGALVGAFTLGIANKFLEPFAGAVLAKIVVLVAIILFIQKRPRGLFALKGRVVET